MKQQYESVKKMLCLYSRTDLDQFIRDPYVEEEAEHTEPQEKQEDRVKPGTKSLSLFSAGIGKEEIPTLKEKLQLLPHLESLCLKRNALGSGEISILTEAFPDLPQLRTLNLEDNNLTTKDARDLAKALSGFPNLQSLYLQGNNVGNQGARALIRAVLQFRVPEEEDPARKFANPPGFPTFSCLSLTNNKLQPKDVTSLKNVLESIHKKDRAWSSKDIHYSIEYRPSRTSFRISYQKIIVHKEDPICYEHSIYIRLGHVKTPEIERKYFCW